MLNILNLILMISLITFLLNCYLNGLFKKKMEDIIPFCGVIDTFVLNFWWFSVLDFKAWVDSPLSPTCNRIPRFCLMQHLLTSWHKAWQPSCFNPYTWKQHCLLLLATPQSFFGTLFTSERWVHVMINFAGWWESLLKF